MADEKDTSPTEQIENDSTTEQAAEKQEEQLAKPIVSLVDIDISTIYGQLHKKALEMSKAKEKGVAITNSAIDESGKFQGAGQHIVSTVALDPKNPIDKNVCIEVIKNYVQWFVSPEESGKINDATVVPLTKPMTDAEKKEQSSSDEEKPTEDKKEDDTSKDKPEGEPKDTETKESLTSSQSSLFKLLFESSQQEDEEVAKEKGEKLIGYYIQYLLEVGNQKVSSVDSNWKKLAKFGGDWLKSFGVTSFNWMTGATGDKITVGDVMNDLSKAIDPEKLKSSVSKQFEAEWPGMKPQFEVLNSKQVMNHLKSKLTAKDKTALKNAKYALCIKVYKNEQNYELISKQDIADMITKGTNRNKVSKNDVIYVNNYEDNKKDKEANKFVSTTTKESLSDRNYDLYALLFENSLDLFVENKNSELAKKINAELDADPKLEKKLKNYKGKLVTAKNSKVTDDDVKSKLSADARKTALNTLSVSVLNNIISAIDEIKNSVSENDDILKQIYTAYSTYQSNVEKNIDGIEKIKKDVRDVLLNTKGIYDKLDNETQFKEALNDIEDRKQLSSILRAFEQFNDKFSELDKSNKDKSAKTADEQTSIEDKKKKLDELKKLYDQAKKLDAFETNSKNKEIFRADQDFIETVDKLLKKSESDEGVKTISDDTIKDITRKLEDKIDALDDSKSTSTLFDEVKSLYAKAKDLDAFENNEKNKDAFRADQDFIKKVDELLQKASSDKNLTTISKDELTDIKRKLEDKVDAAKDRKPEDVKTNKTDVDYYIIPMKNIKVEEPEADTKPGK